MHHHAGLFAGSCLKIDSSVDQVSFTSSKSFSEFYTGKDIADIFVNEEDLFVHNSVPKNKYPKI